jgi:hypothetical protein
MFEAVVAKDRRGLIAKSLVEVLIQLVEVLMQLVEVLIQLVEVLMQLVQVLMQLVEVYWQLVEVLMQLVEVLTQLVEMLMLLHLLAESKDQHSKAFHTRYSVSQHKCMIEFESISSSDSEGHVFAVIHFKMLIISMTAVFIHSIVDSVGCLRDRNARHTLIRRIVSKIECKSPFSEKGLPVPVPFVYHGAYSILSLPRYIQFSLDLFQMSFLCDENDIIALTLYAILTTPIDSGQLQQAIWGLKW